MRLDTEFLTLPPPEPETPENRSTPHPSATWPAQKTASAQLAYTAANLIPARPLP